MRAPVTILLGSLIFASAAPSCGGSATGDDAGVEPSAAGAAGARAGEGGASGGGSGGAGGTSGGAAGGAGGSGGASGAGTALAYNRVRQKSSHNSYERYEAIFDQLVFHRLRSLEFDVHVGRDGEPALSGDWYVYHFDLPGLTPKTNCTKLSDCLAELAAFHAAVPGHEVATIFIDLKDDFASGHSPEGLDALLRSSLPEGSIFGPEGLLAACPGAADLRAAVGGACAWPSIESLRGKFIFALTGGDTCDASSKLSAYAGGAAAGGRAAFVMPEITGGCPLSRLLEDRKTVFLNMKSGGDSDPNARLVREAGLVGRVYDLNDEGSWVRAHDGLAHVLATDKVNLDEDPWARVSPLVSSPFGCLGGCDLVPPEASPPVGLRVSSGDIEGSGDSFLFVHEAPLEGPQAWASYISTENSHVEPFAKGCLMARGAEGPSSRYFAVCRPADEGRIRVQFRHSDGGGTEVVDDVPLAPDGTVPHDSWAFVKLELAPAASSGGVTATGSASRDGVAWVRVASHAFDAPLSLQGLAASAHGAGAPVTFYFGRVERASGAETRSYSEADFKARTPVGGATGMSAQGYMP